MKDLTDINKIERNRNIVIIEHKNNDCIPFGEVYCVYFWMTYIN